MAEFKVPFKLDDEFRQRLRVHSKQEKVNLERLIEEEGCADGAFTVGLIGGDKILVDGYTTLAVCQEKGIVPSEPRYLPFKDREAALEWIDLHQRARRNLTAEEMAANRAERIERVVEARAEGKSIQTIADDEGVPKATIQRDLKASGVSRDTGENNNGKVTGKDGKKYDAVKPPPPPPDFDDAPENGAKPEPALCNSCQHNKKIGRSLPDDCQECKKLRKKKPSPPKPKHPDDLPKSVANALADTWHAECARLLSKMATEAKGAFGWSSWLDGSVLDYLKNAEECFLTAIPRKVCPDCKGQKTIDKESCQRCRGGGYLASQE